MVRIVLIVLLGLSLCFTLWAVATGSSAGPVPGAVGTVIVLLALLFERTRYKPILEEPPQGEGWSPTAERFIDSRSGREVTVWHQASTGKRAYVGGPEA